MVTLEPNRNRWLGSVPVYTENRTEPKLLLPVRFRFQVLENRTEPADSAPSEIPGLSIIFQQTQPLGDFVTAEIVLTTRPATSDLPRPGNNNKIMKLAASVKALKKKKNYVVNNEETNDTLFSEVSAVAKSDKFYVLDITDAFKTAVLSCSEEERFLQHPHKFEVQLVGGAGVEFDRFDLQVERPFVIFSYRHDFDAMKGMKRRKRSISTSSGETNNSIPTLEEPRAPNSLCHREDWNVDTHADIEWYDMVQPKRLELGFCAGACPFPLQNDHFNYTLHTFFQDRHRLHKIFDIPKNFPKTCCVPVSYKPVKAWIEEEENSIVYRIFPDVAVDQCGCR
ncbi:Bone morphogenetic protein 4 [Folsomia candida]|uniref:Bone morphogenetic protein 4 n=1 Tax=Folsomia candida TaxID=158441 RepID=A0A226DS19_FOLCA|nr:Bone morphogenetic protein 4 [Folsomia candida]